MSAGMDTIQTNAEAPVVPQGQEAQAAATPRVQEQEQVQDEFRYVLPTGSKYRDEADLVNGSIAKDLEIERQKTLIANLKAAQFRPQPQQPTAPQDPVTQVADEIYREMKQEFPDRDDADLKAWAKVQAKREVAREVRQENLSRSQVFEAQYKEIRTKDPGFSIHEGLGAQIFDDFPGRSPREHYAIYKLEMEERGLSPKTPQLNGATAAAGMYIRPFNNAGGGSATSHEANSAASHSYVERAVEHAKSRGIKDQVVLDSIKQRAIDNLPNVLKHQKR